MNTITTISSSPKQLSSKAKLFSIAILLIAIVGTSMPFIHMVFPKRPQEVKDLRAALERCEITDAEYLRCRLEQRKIYNWFGYGSLYMFLAKIGKPFPVICCTLMILYCIKYIGEQRVRRTILFSGTLLLFASLYSFVYSFSKKTREEVFIFDVLDFHKYGNLIFYHILIFFLSILLTTFLVQIMTSKKTFLDKIKILIYFITRTRTQIISSFTSTTIIHSTNQEQFDQELYTTLNRIKDQSHRFSLVKLRYKTWSVYIICCSIIGSIALLAYPLHPNSGVNEYISIRKEYWDGKINRETLVQKKILFNKKYFPNISLKNQLSVKKRSHPLGLVFSLIILFLLFPFINEKYAKRGTLITAIAFSCIAIFHLRWAFFRFEGKVQDYHINYYYAMMSISTILIILVVYQFIQSAITYKYKMMELIHFIVDSRKQVFNALETQNNTATAIQQQKEQFDEEFYDTLDKVTKK